MSAEYALVLIALLTIKHYFGDYPLQTYDMIMKKGTYGHPMGILHSLVHVVLSSVILSVTVAHSYQYIALLCAIEFVVHYHMDWTKMNLERRYNLGMTSRTYWQLFGFDQLVHHLTYVWMVWMLL